MTARARRILKPVPVLVLLAACEGRSPSPTEPSAPSSFLTGTWTGTVTIQVVISAKRFSGSYNDGYVDNVGLHLSH